ncbi:hypothetical protein WG66_006525 [Moniliophthora roreri]|nr:hypothetical protein WG66_006525 [Moniliophthora roreri]
MAFEYASSITLSGGQFSTQFQHVHGNLGNLVRPVQAAGGELMIWDNYRCVQASDICLTHHIADTEVRRDKDENWSGLVARRIISVATIPSITGDQRFLYIQYSGEDAYKVGTSPVLMSWDDELICTGLQTGF